MQIWTLLTRIQCKVSDTHVTIKACGSLVIFKHVHVPLFYFQTFTSSDSIVKLF